jgi:flap endonuclease-1
MGIKNFNVILKRANAGVSSTTYAQFSGQSVAIDASIFCYRFSHNPQSKKPNSHLDGFYKLFTRLLKYKIRPVLVFDGKSPQEKQHTLEERAKQKQKNINKVKRIQQELIQILGSDVPLKEVLNHIKGQPIEEEVKTKVEALNRASKCVIHFQPGIFDDIRMLCDLMNIPCLRAHGEADALCANLYKTGQVQAIMSEDSDILLYGGARLIRKIGWTNEVELVELDQILQSLKISYDQFIDLAILFGTDYTSVTITGVGHITALDYILSGMTIEQILAQQTRVPPSELFPYQNARDLIKNSSFTEPETVITPFEINQLKGDQLVTLLSDKCHYRPITIQNHVEQLHDIYRPRPAVPKVKIFLKAKK